MNLLSPRKLYTMKSIKPAQQSMRVRFDMLPVLRENAKEKLVFCVPDGLYDEAVIAGEVEERAAFARGGEFGENVLGCEGEEVVCRIQREVVFAEFAEDPRSIVFEFEVISRRGSKFVPDDIERVFMPCGKILFSEGSFYLCLAS
jgi:hypothetical protein